MKHVVVLGGGVAGMTAAHELALRNYRVTVLERNAHVAGGKSKTQPFLHSGLDGRSDLPGEHGFRFFPGFYRHVPDTMRRIPFEGNARGVFDNLVSAKRSLWAMWKGPTYESLVRLPRNLGDLKVALTFPEQLRTATVDGSTVSDEEWDFFVQKVIQILTSCKERRDNEYERISWWDFVEADRFSPAYQQVLATGATRNFVASKAQQACTKTIGNMMTQLLSDFISPGETADRLLNGPTNEAWIDPWLTHLETLGVEYKFGAVAHTLTLDTEHKRVRGVQVEQNGRRFELQADSFVCALPVEYAIQVIPKEMKNWDPILDKMGELVGHLGWMSGVQYFLNYEQDLVPGHINSLGTPWALTAIAEDQFWPRLDLRQYGDGTTRTILSVDISDWETPGTEDGPARGRAARDCTPDEVAAEAWQQLKDSVNLPDHAPLRDYQSYWLDEEVVADPTGKHRLSNRAHLLVNLVNGWALRPDARTKIDNFVLAGDYVRTHTDLASMEAANEAARRAVNQLLARDHYQGCEGFCQVWDLHELPFLATFRALDRQRYEGGKPWQTPLGLPEPLFRELISESTRLFDLTTDMLEHAVDPREHTRMRQLWNKTWHAVSDWMGDRRVSKRAHSLLSSVWGRAPQRPWWSYRLWQHQLTMAFRVDPQQLAALLPAGLTVDTHDGDAWVSVVSGRMQDLHFNLPRQVPGGPEVPSLVLQAYVRHNGRPGTYALSADCDPGSARMVRTLLREAPYRPANIWMQQRADGALDFCSERLHRGHRTGANLRVRYAAKGQPSVAATGSLAHFLVDRACYYTWEDKQLRRVDVCRQAPVMQPAEVHLDEQQLAWTLPSPLQLPKQVSAAFYCASSEMLTWTPKRPAR